MRSSPLQKKWLQWGLCLGLLQAVVPFLLGLASPVGTDAQAEDGGERDEHFVIEWTAPAPHPGVGYGVNVQLKEALAHKELGLVEMRRRQVNGRWQLELDVIFPFEDVRLLAVERLEGPDRGLVWRELARGAGRTLRVEWSQAGDQLRIREWSAAGSRRKQLDPRGTLRMPQSLVELARHAQTGDGSFEVFDPLQNKLDVWAAKCSTVPALAAGESWRQVDFQRSDGSLAGRYQFHGKQLMMFQWQDGGMRMRRLSPEQFAQRRTSWGLDSK